MTDIKVKILSDRKVEIPYRRFGGTQGDAGYRIEFDISAIYEDDRIYRVEWYGAADSFTQTVPLEVTEGIVYAVVPNEICKVGGTAKAFLVEEKTVNDEVVEKICTYPVRLYFNNKPTRDNNSVVDEYERNVTDMYLSVVNTKEKADKKYESAVDSLDKAALKLLTAQTRYEEAACLMSSALKHEIVSELPEENISATTVYLVPSDISGENNIYDEYIFIPNGSESDC